MSLIAHYRFEGNPNDATGKYDGTLSSTPGDTIGKLGNAYNFNTNRMTIGIPQLQIFSVSFWLNVNVNSDDWIVSTQTTTNTDYLHGWLIRTDDINKNVFMFAGNGSITVSSYSANDDVIIGDWVHAIFTCDGDRVRSYINDSLTGISDPLTTGIDYTSVLDTTIASHNTSTAVYLDAKLDDVRIYDHVLSERERAELWRAKVLHYTFDDFQEPTVNRISNGNFGDSTNGWTIGDRGADFGDTWDFQIDEYGDSYLHVHFSRDSGSGNSWGSMRKIALNPGDTGTYTESCYVRINETTGSEGQVRLSAVTNDFWTTSKVHWTVNVNREFNVWHKLELTSVDMGNNGDSYALNLQFEIYTGNQDTVGEIMDFDLKFVQIEEKDHATSFVGDSRTGVVKDSSGQGNDSTALSQTYTPEWRGDSAAVGNGYYHFTNGGVNNINTDYIEAFTDAQAAIWLDSEDLHGITVMAWARSGDTLSYATSGGRIITRDSSDYWAIRIEQDELFPQDALFTTEPATSVTIDDVVNENEWVHLALTRNIGDSITKFYVNGVLGDSTASGVGAGSLRAVVIGNNTETTPGPNLTAAFQGDITDVRIYMNTLTEKEVLEIVHTRASVDSGGNLWASHFKETKIQDRSLLNWQDEWTIGNSGTQGSFGRNGDVDENTVISGLDPWGDSTKVWEAIPDTVTDPDGGWNKSFTCDSTKRYRMSVFIKKTGDSTTSRTEGNTYFGCESNPPDSLNLDGSTNINPYFVIGDPPTLNEWYLWVGLLHPYSGDTRASWDVSGVYDLTGTKQVIGTETEFKMTPGQISQRHRTYLYYTLDDSTIRQYWCYPRVDVVDGSEPSIQDLVNGIDSTYQSYYAEGDSENTTGLAVRESTHIGTMNEIGPINGLSAWYKLDRDATDSYGSNNGTVVGGDSSGFAIKGQSFYFISTGQDHITIPNSIVDMTKPFAVSIWFYGDSTAEDTRPRMFGLENGSGYGIQIWIADGSYYFGANVTDDGLVWDSQRSIGTSLNTWHHGVINCDSYSSINSIYLNGDSHALTTLSLTGTVYSAIGAGTNTAGSYTWQGYLDDVRIYNRNLTTEEANSLYSMYSPDSNVKLRQTNNGIVYISGEFKENL